MERSEAILEPDLPIVDPHHHLWDRPATLVAALSETGHGFEDIIRAVPRYLLDELLADLQSGHNVRATVYLECGAMYRADGPEALRCVGETEFVTGVAAMTASGLYGDVRACAAIVGHADLRLGAAVEEVLRAHLAAAGGRFRGVRQSASWDEDPKVLGPLAGRVPAGLYRDATFRDGFALLQRLGLSSTPGCSSRSSPTSSISRGRFQRRRSCSTTSARRSASRRTRGSAGRGSARGV